MDQNVVYSSATKEYIDIGNSGANDLLKCRREGHKNAKVYKFWNFKKPHYSHNEKS